jgi:endonuclease IV
LGAFTVTKGYGFPHQCLSRQRTQRVHASHIMNLANKHHVIKSKSKNHANKFITHFSKISCW